MNLLLFSYVNRKSEKYFSFSFKSIFILVSKALSKFLDYIGICEWILWKGGRGGVLVNDI